MRYAVAVVLAAAIAAPAAAQPAAGSEEALARAVANPIANLISVPLQNNLDFGAGPRQATADTLNIQPVVPLRLGGDWSVVTRTILPLMYHGSTATGDDDRSGLGDTSISLFLHREQRGDGPLFGFGPIFRIPTATDDRLGNRRWGAGPTAILVQDSGAWTFGLLASHLWSFGASPERPEVNATAIQPFVTRHFAGGFTLNATSETVYDWTLREWVVPLNLQAAQIVKIGAVPASLFIGPRIYLQRPSQGPDWGLRFGIQFLFPS